MNKFWHKPDPGMQHQDPPLETIQAPSEKEAWKRAKEGELARVLTPPAEPNKQKLALLQASAERRRSK